MTAAAEGARAAAPASAEATGSAQRTAGSFGQALRDARRAANAGRRALGARASEVLARSRAAPRRAPGSPRRPQDASRTVAPDAGPSTLRDSAPVAQAPPLTSAAVVSQVTLASQGLGPAASLELRFPGELGIALTQTPQGVAVVVDPGALPRVRALAELPGLVRALRDRGVPVASARVAGAPAALTPVEGSGRS